jgi:hypothetical protein
MPNPNSARDGKPSFMSATRDDLVRTIKELLKDLQRNRDRAEWENPTLDRFLEAMGSWVDDYGRAYNVVEPTWDFVMLMLTAAKIYE